MGELAIELEDKREQAAWTIHAFAVTHGIVAFTLANTLIGDTAILTALTYSMITCLGKIYEVQKVSPIKLLARIFGLVAGTYIAGKLLFFLPGIGNMANASTSMFITETIGWTCVNIFESGCDAENISKEKLKSIVKDARAEAEKNRKETKEVMSKANADEKERFKDIATKLKDSSTSENERGNLTCEIKNLYATIKNR